MSNSKLNDILSEINKTRPAIKSFAPSAGKDVELTPLTLAQQKLIIETTSDQSLGVLFFNTIFYKILKENLRDDINNYNTVDRVPLTLSLRRYMKDDIELDSGATVKISDIFNNYSQIKYDIEPVVIESENYTFYVKAPNLTLDNQVNTLLLNKYKNISLDQNKLKTLISDLYTYEILKFIEKLTINEHEFEVKPQESSLRVIESIGSNHFKDIIEYINNVRDVEVKYSKLENDAIDITPELFIV